MIPINKINLERTNKKFNVHKGLLIDIYLSCEFDFLEDGSCGCELSECCLFILHYGSTSITLLDINNDERRLYCKIIKNGITNYVGHFYFEDFITRIKDGAIK